MSTRTSTAATAQASRIPSSVSKSDKYFTLHNSVATYETQAYISPESETPSDWDVKVLKARDITAAIGSTARTRIRDVHLVYDDGSVSILFPISECIVEHRPSIGTTQVRKTESGTSSFKTGYGVTYFSLGIPIDVYRVLEKKIASDAKTKVHNEKLDTHDDYAWMPVKCAEKVKCFVAPPAPEDPEKEIDPNDILIHESLAGFIKDLGVNALGDALLSIRLKCSGTRGATLGEKWELAMTLSSFFVYSDTDKQSTPLNNRVEVFGVMRSAAGLVHDRIRHAKAEAAALASSKEQESKSLGLESLSIDGVDSASAGPGTNVAGI